MRKIKKIITTYPVFMNAAPKIKGSKKPLMTVKNLTNESADLYIYGEIVDNTDWKWDETDVMPNDVLDALHKVDGLNELNIYINSPGGSVFAGLAIYNMLKRNKAKKIVYVDGVAASIASVIALAGDEVHIPSNAFLMVHKPWTIAMGDSTFFRKIADDLDNIQSGIMNVYKENLAEGADEETIEKMVEEETWLTGEEAAKYFNVKLLEATKVAASSKEFLKNYEKPPQKLVEESQKKPEQSQQNHGNTNLKMRNELELLEI